MKDIHSHILFGIDDGSKSIEESISLLEKMEEAGTTDLMLTPHYVEHTKYNCNNTNKMKVLKELQNRIKEEKISINLYLGNEVFVTDHFLELIKKKEVKTLHNSKYLLFEYPMRNVTRNAVELVGELVREGYIPVLAHPERYDLFQKTPKLLEEFLKKGILMQGNFTSLFGKYGRKSEKTLKYFLKRKWIVFLGSDTHHDVEYDSIKLEKKLLKITKDPEYVKDLLERNFDRVLQNKDIGMIR